MFQPILTTESEGFKEEATIEYTSRPNNTVYQLRTHLGTIEQAALGFCASERLSDMRGPFHHPDIERLPINVFLSSTYVDLRKHREQVHLALDRLKWPRIQRMEAEPGQEGSVLSHCLEMIEDCQVYVCLIGSQYGTTIEDNETCLSMTEREFDYATELKLYRVVLFSQSSRSANGELETSLEAFKTKAKQAIWPDYFKNEDDVGSKVSVALSNRWNELNGRMFVAVFRPWEDYARSAQPIVELRTSIAQDCGIPPYKVWVTSPNAPIPEVTTFVVLLPNYCKNYYLNLGINTWSGQVIHASHYEPDSPRFGTTELYDLYSTLNNLLKKAPNRCERYDAINKWISRWRQTQIPN